MGMGVFGLTMATPFVFLSLFPSRAQKMPGAGAWMNTLKVFLGFVELAAALKFLSTADLAWEWGFLSKEVFLILWAGIFAIAALFLFGKINLKGEESGAISPGRMVAGTATFLFAIYCGFLTFGFKMDPLLTAFAPPYSTAPAASQAQGEGHEDEAWTMVVDDWDGALARARSEQKLLLVNFTGFN
jgi:thiol:disulfide interchange protein DsbD